ncbi:MAG: site-specific integrase [Candidatus Gastranaerophilales bacterium]|nr:site-specific integrase [Candidatus Gastranaerophilales bacterium]
MEIVSPIKDKEKIERMKRLLAHNKRDLLLFTLGINSGLRVSDLLALNVKDVKNKSFITIREKKTNKYKQFPINEKLKPLIYRVTDFRDLEEPLFLSQKNCRLSRTQAYRMLRNTAIRAGIKDKIGTHSLRKTFGYHHYKQFNDIVLLQKILNHSSPAVTLRYIGLDQEEINNSYKNFSL